MPSATLSALAGSLLSPLREVSLEKLIGYLWDYLSSSPSPSSPDEAEKQQQLKDSLEALEDAKLTVRSLQSRIMKLFQKHKQNERVVGLHNKLKDVGYDIQDLESEMKYMQLERKVHEINKAEEEEEAATADSTSSRFSLKRPFPFGLPSVSFSKKKRRLPTSSQSSSLSTDEDIVRQATSIVKQIKSIESGLKEEAMLEDLFDQLKLNGVYDAREYHFTQNERVTTSSTNERKIYGRNNEIQWLIEFLTGPNVDNSNVFVVPIVGMGGMGKTTLAQFVFNHEEIEDHFNNKAWIYVSNHFDRYRITKEMLHVINPNVQCCSTSNLDFLERELQRHLTGKKFLLVLDDIWSDEWQWLLAPLRSSQAQVIKIIVTCRDPTVLRSIDERNKIILKGSRIVQKLMGSPLAAKTVGKLLGRDLTEKHWNDVLENDLWKLKTDAHDIMPALALSYYHLPQHLQQCFVFCSVLPKDCLYSKDALIYMWIANGYIHESGSSSKAMNDIGEDYYYELVAMCFFSEFKIGYNGMVMHDLMRDLARLVSHNETYIYESGKDKEISKNVRHLYAECSIDQGLVHETNKLRTLMLKSTKDMFAILNHGAFNKIRVLVIFDSNMQEFPNVIPRLKHLQYLDLRGTQIKSIPDSICELYLLRVLALPWPQTLPSRFHSLINLEKLCMSGDLNYLVYYVNKEMGFMVAQLRNMNELRTKLSINGLQKIDNREEAMKAKLKEKHHIKSLQLGWDIDTVDDDCKHNAEEVFEVLESLQPHPNLEELCIYGYMGCNMPNWLKTLQKLKKIELTCYRKYLLSTLGLSPFIEELHFCYGENITIECESCDDSESEMFPSLQLLSLKNTTVSFTGIPTSSSSPTTPGRCKVFPRLQKLTVEDCNEMNGFPWPICIALKELVIRRSPGMDDKLLGCLRGLSSLTQLTLTRAKIKTFDAEVVATLHALSSLELSYCDELLSLEGLQALSSLKYLDISDCPKFKSWCTAEMAKLRSLYIQSCQDLESLPTWLHRCSSLEKLTIWYCPKLLPLPEGGLPSSLEDLDIRDCDPGFLQRCRQEGSPEWLMIQHIPNKKIR
ncbi:P-loop containing nucleoside triphosphate hydrolase protein [Dioscorea alata]|uniref:P-loop containing nucleoside triphosphate hydrolase protein n=2 Tax=Dioscorea alata TaxID=55571 RepID=A0ACB7WMI8_DIOAL|nr:P-loop containing nucleoside triphosphate hydrolase protein [Dioscorea alata]KAH7689351.1 P-loop containing nucleoside triphosphate hydrolase protein [Dioscorea alata]